MQADPKKRFAKALKTFTDLLRKMIETLDSNEKLYSLRESDSESLLVDFIEWLIEFSRSFSFLFFSLPSFY